MKSISEKANPSTYIYTTNQFIEDMKESLLNHMAATYVLICQIVSSRMSIGENIFGSEWDLVIILDACRVDALREVSDEYDFLTDIDTVMSTGSTSIEWMHNTFTEEYLEDIQETTYVTANGFASQLETKNIDRLETSETMGTFYQNSGLANSLINNNTAGGEFKSLELVNGAELDGSGSKKHYHPDIVTAKAISKAREENSDKMIVHYMQPHAPYIAEAISRGTYMDYEESPFQYLKEGGEKSQVWEAYLDNLRLVLDSVETLLNNAEAEDVVITADHGELFGEFGLYSHIYGVPHPKLRRVPWVRTTASDERTTCSDTLLSAHNIDSEDEDVEERLEALGYIS